MQKPLVFIVLVLLVGVGVYFTFFWGDGGAPIAPEARDDEVVIDDNDAASATHATSNGSGAAPGAVQRTEVATVGFGMLAVVAPTSIFCVLRGLLGT